MDNTDKLLAGVFLIFLLLILTVAVCFEISKNRCQDRCRPFDRADVSAKCLCYTEKPGVFLEK